MLVKTLLTVNFALMVQLSMAQTASLTGKVISENGPVSFANVFLKGTQTGSTTDMDGKFLIKNIPFGTYTVMASSIGFDRAEQSITLRENDKAVLDFKLVANSSTLDEVVISGTMREVSKLESPVPVEVYTAKFFKKNPNPSIFEGLQNVNGVRPQINCNVCNTGDIHINGLEGPYTMILIDGMPIVSGLSTVYGLSGIPQSMIERVEIVKGPASTLYGSEAVGGLINVITKKPTNAPIFSADVFGTSWGEMNADIAGKFRIGEKAQSLIGVNYFNYSQTIDNDEDGFTDVTLQDRISIFNKWNFERKDNRVFSLAGRYVYEDRWGGETNWKPENRGGDDVYGESIYTSRWELFGTYQLPVKEKIMFQFSANGHDQNSVYGQDFYLADQKIAFGQLNWFKTLGKHNFLTGLTYRYTYYNDNTTATDFTSDRITNLPGIFVQDEITLNEQNKLLLGMRYDYNSNHGNIFTPRFNYKWNSKDQKNTLRLSIGNGYRVVNLFTEDHAFISGARDVEVLSDIKPETSWNGNINFVKKIFTRNGTFIGLDASAFYTYFTNQVIPDYDTDPTKIIYDNLDGYSVAQGLSLNIDVALPNGLKLLAGGTLMDVYNVDGGVKTWQAFSERFAGVWSASYTFNNGLSVDYTGNVYSPMRIPLQNDLDPRRERSPWWSIQNIQLTKKFKNGFELYGGVKNLLNWTPNKGNPFIIARSDDPFDNNVKFDGNGDVMPTANNPYALIFDPVYVYGPNQGARGFLGIRYTFE